MLRTSIARIFAFVVAVSGFSIVAETAAAEFICGNNGGFRQRILDCERDMLVEQRKILDELEKMNAKLDQLSELPGIKSGLNALNEKASARNTELGSIDGNLAAANDLLKAIRDKKP